MKNILFYASHRSFNFFIPAARYFSTKDRCKYLFLSAFLLLTSALSAQTLVTAPMTGTPAAGEYYNYNSITLAPGFSFTAGPGQSLHIYIGNSDCQPLANNISANQNYVLTSTPRIPGYNPSASGYGSCDVMQTVQYFDGLGRPSQTVQIKGSPSNMDIVTPVAYDQFGREASKYLSYAATTADGSYKTDALQSGSGLFNFYNPAGTAASVTQLSGGIPHINTPYAVSGFEASPLNRVVEQGAPGDAWQLSTSGVSGSGHTIKIAYGTNEINDVILWTVNAGGGATGNTFYTAGQLYATITTNENGYNTIEYKDKEDKVICRKVQSGTSPVTYLTTSYVYDDLNNLAYVIPPIPSGQYPSAFAETDPVFSNYIYGYHYDQRKRLVEKHIPGKKWEYMVYNTLDQVVASQDGNQRASGQWSFTKYDALARIVWMGTWNNGGTAVSRIDLQNTVNGFTGSLWESRPIGGYPTNVAWPTTGFSGQLMINYYDDYTFPDAQYATPASASSHTKGLLTGTKTYVLNSVAVLYTQFYYDDLGRSTTTLKEHYLGGTTGQPNPGNYDEITNTYDFSNNITSTVRHHYTTASTTAASLIVTDTYTYNHMNRRKQNWGSVASGSSTAPNLTLLSQIDYNEVGQAMTKHLHSETGAAPFLQDINYTYNERGWLNGSGSGLFSFNLQYNNPDTGINPMFNGNIAEMKYSAPKNGSKVFGYTYDPLNRLTAASSTSNLLNEQIAYDPLGNITSLTRTGASTAGLAYSYDLNGSNKGNQLQSVSNNGNAFRSYSYDDNGNATSDGTNKSIAYNFLNLPQTVTQNSNIIATYIYDAKGNKLRNTGNDGSWDYIDGIVYNNSAISFVQTEEGRAIPNGGNYHYEYNLSDHLGNVRVSFDKDPSTGQAREIQEDEYYSFGLRNSGGYNFANNNRYLYNGKELQTDLSNQYDYGVRFYDPVIARWNVVDPLAEKDRKTSPYTYVFNNPIRFIDPDGMEGTSTHTDKFGEVLAVYEDGDLGVYKHEDNADGSTPTKENINKRHETSTSAGGEKMGETEFWDEFMTIGKNRHEEGTIHFGESWDKTIDTYNDMADRQDLSVTADQSKNNKRFDIKTADFLAPEGVMTGKLLDGKYASARSAGNYLAGLNGRTGVFQGQHISRDTYMKIAGALNQKKFSPWNVFRIMTFGTEFGPAPYYGEDKYSGRMILNGWNSNRR